MCTSFPLGNLPTWGGAVAFLAAWAAYARRKRLQHAIEAAQERAERAARLAAQRARVAALIAAVALDQARRRLTHPAPAEDAEDHAPLPRDPRSLDLTAWRQADYGQMAHAQEVAQGSEEKSAFTLKPAPVPTPPTPSGTPTPLGIPVAQGARPSIPLQPLSLL